MSTLNGQWIEVFRTGDYGPKGNFTPADLDKIVANYDPANHEAPVTLGHPENDAPAYGWVEGLRRSGETLLAKLKQVPAAFEELVRGGRFKKRSIALYQGANGPTLRHVGFLGALPPEVKGLADVNLCEFTDRGRAIIFFGEEMSTNSLVKFNDSPNSVFDDGSAQLAEVAQRLVNKGRFKTFGEALRYARRNFADATQIDGPGVLSNDEVVKLLRICAGAFEDNTSQAGSSDSTAYGLLSLAGQLMSSGSVPEAQAPSAKPINLDAKGLAQLRECLGLIGG